MEKTTGRRVYQKKGRQKAVLGEREKRRLTQLIVCLFLFCALFYTKGRDRLNGFCSEVSSVLGTSADFQGAVTDLNWSINSGHPIGETLGRLLGRVFLPKGIAAALGHPGPLYQQARQELGANGQGAGFWTRSLNVKKQTDPMTISGAKESTELFSQTETNFEEPEIVIMDYSGPSLPDNTTMDRYNLHLEQTVSPVMAVLSSGFGWRDHPIEKEERFHYGVDLAADTGTPILAYASGTVDYIGESDIYGQYLQLRHDNGVTSFYAHCSKLCVQQGQQVTVGEKVAESGATGDVTGPHLHFELKKDGIRLNPLYYIQTLI